MSTPPEAGKVASVRVDEDFREDLAVLLEACPTVTDAVRHAVSLIASGYRYAWEHGVTPRGEHPNIVGLEIIPTPVSEGEPERMTGRMTGEPERMTVPDQGGSAE